MEPDVGLAQVVLPSLLGLGLLDRVKMLFAKTRPVHQMPFVDLEDAIEAGIKDRGQRDHASGKRVSLAHEGQTDPDDGLGRTEIDAARWDLDLRIAKERTAEDGDHGGGEVDVSKLTHGFIVVIDV